MGDDLEQHSKKRKNQRLQTLIFSFFKGYSFPNAIDLLKSNGYLLPGKYLTIIIQKLS